MVMVDNLVSWWIAPGLYQSLVSQTLTLLPATAEYVSYSRIESKLAQQEGAEVNWPTWDNDRLKRERNREFLPLSGNRGQKKRHKRSEKSRLIVRRKRQRHSTDYDKWMSNVGRTQRKRTRQRQKEGNLEISGKVNINGFSYNYKKGKSFKTVKIGKQQKEEQGKGKGKRITLE